jgi:hypothetical protein
VYWRLLCIIPGPVLWLNINTKTHRRRPCRSTQESRQMATTLRLASDKDVRTISHFIFETRCISHLVQV